MKSQTKTKKITVRFSKRLKEEMLQSLIHSGYGLRGKSKWLKDSINNLLNQSDYLDYVEQGIDINQAELSEVEAFYIDFETLQIMKKAFLSIRIKFPLFEGVQSALIRASAVYRIMLN